MKELQDRLKAFPGAKKTAKDKAELVQRLSDYMHRQEVLGELQIGKDLYFFLGNKTMYFSHFTC